MRDRSNSVLNRPFLDDALAEVRDAAPSVLRADGPWALKFSGYPHAKVVGVAAGSCWISTTEVAPVRLRAGESYLLTGGSAYVVASDPRLTPESGPATFTGTGDGVARYSVGRGGPGETRLVGGALGFGDPAAARMLLRALPGTALLGAEVLGTLTLLAAEAATPGPVGAAVRRHLTRVLSLQAMGTLLELADPPSPADPAIEAALDAMHARPGHRWTVATLATVAGTSRTVFAARFAAATGLPPMEYLLRHRMRGAGADLAAGRTVAATARRWGYASESAFSAAFKRTTGRSPAASRR
ncbi:AraC family transcriptional regulator [Cryptosporangium phraense]|uniref:AraC family transcriptional regulator n=1 Tax=Cryptosporangium phraense TaxID=2593070 RepID=A0A545ATQ8_9ACTN|nr:AraC family transcriptional regulator [Cryptosporangium phraense]TQS44718.1 AraC family transcriptional regulator [Cryptosporangium phraense]